MKTIKFSVTGITPLMMHNGQMANPFNPFAKELKRLTGSKRSKDKTDDDLLKLSEIEFKGGLYLDNDKPCIPGDIWEAAIISGAKNFRKGTTATNGIRILDNSELIYDGPKNIDDLWNDGRFVDRRLVAIGTGKSKSKILRTRPIFSQWKCVVEIMYDETLFNKNDIIEIVKKTGELGVLMEYKGRYGKFNIIEL